MFLCVAVLNVIRMVFDLIIEIVEWVVETVCGWVTTVIHHVKEVCDKVCGWLGPFSWVCDWVCTVIKWTETITDWVCKEVLKRVVVGFIRIVFELVFYILTWVCWIIEWIPRLIDLGLCKLGFHNTRFVHICIKVLARDRTSPSWSQAKVDQLIAETATRLRQCNVEICVLQQETIETDDHQTGVDCGVSMFGSSNFYWFSANECRGSGAIMPITVFFIEDIVGSKGCSIPGANFVLADLEASNATIAHEIGHLCDLWMHSSDPSNVMFSPSTDASVDFSGNQCCMIRSSKYVTTATLCPKLAKGAPSTVRSARSAMSAEPASPHRAQIIRQSMIPHPRPCGCAGAR